MARRSRYTDAEWAAHSKGCDLASAGRSLRVPKHLTANQVSAFRDGYQSRKEDMLNSAVATELRHILGGVSFGEVMQQLVRA
jgi:hypothetical protein